MCDARAQRRGAHVRISTELLFLLALLFISCASLLSSPRIRHIGEDAFLHIVASQHNVFYQHQANMGGTRAVRVLVDQSETHPAATNPHPANPTTRSTNTHVTLVATEDLLFKPFIQARASGQGGVGEQPLLGDLSFESTHKQPPSAMVHGSQTSDHVSIAKEGVVGALPGGSAASTVGTVTKVHKKANHGHNLALEQLKHMQKQQHVVGTAMAHEVVIQGGVGVGSVRIDATATIVNNTNHASNAAETEPSPEPFLPTPKIADGPFAGLPMDFNVEQYKMYHPDLHTAGFVSDHDVKLHYLQYGRQEGRLYKRTRLILRYTACTGLMNQQYSHVAAFALAISLGAEIVLPPAATRDSFGKHFSVFRDKNEMAWRPAPLDTLLDVQGIIAHWKQHGLVVHAPPGIMPFPDLTEPETAFPCYTMPNIHPSRVVHLDNIYMQHLDLEQLVERVRFAAVGAASTMLRDNPDMDVGYLVVDLPCTFFMLRTPTAMPLVGQVALSLSFSRAVDSLASLVIQALQGGSGDTGKGAVDSKYNGVHLRIEKDAQDWSTTLGGQQVVWNGYLGAMQAAGFASDMPLYVATGLLTYGASEDMQLTEQRLQASGLCGQVVYKEHVLQPEQLQGLNPEQEALLDFIVLLNSRSFVGFGPSTFSFYLQELRALRGVPRTHSLLVDASVIGTDPLFHLAGHLSDPQAAE